jgi:hypothetical protein
MYLNTHFVVTTCTLAFIYLFRNEHFYFVRNMFMVAMGLALVGYVVYPDRAAAAAARARVRRTRSRTSPASRRLLGQRALQPVRRGAVDARRLRADARRPMSAWPPPLGARSCGRLPAGVWSVVATANHWIFDATARAWRWSGVPRRRVFARARPGRVGLGTGAAPGRRLAAAMSARPRWPTARYQTEFRNR